MSRDDDTEGACQLAQDFGAVVRRLRLARGIGQEELADLAGLHRTSLSLVERGVHVVSLYTATKIAKALDLRLSELLRELEP